MVRILPGGESSEQRYVWRGVAYNLFERYDGSSGYIEQYAVDKFCYSNMFLPGSFLMGDAPMGVLLIILSLWIILGIAVLSDIFAESISVITSEMSQMEVVDTNG
jgi:hypothetical protein